MVEVKEMTLKKPRLSYKRLGFILVLLVFALGSSSVPTFSATVTNINKNKSLETKIRVKEYEKNKLNNVYIKNDSKMLVIKYSDKYNVDWKLVEAIIMHETGNRTSSAFKNKNNSCGMMGKGGILRFENEEVGVEACVKNLKQNYFDQGLNTPEKMQSKYAPVSVTWSSKINYYYRKL